MDDIVVISNMFKGMMNILYKVFERLQIDALNLKAEKCFQFYKSIEYLVHVISTDEVGSDNRKTDIIRDFSIPAMYISYVPFLPSGKL